MKICGKEFTKVCDVNPVPHKFLKPDIQDNIGKKSGVYVFYDNENEKPKYCGQASDTFSKRINGYYCPGASQETNKRINKEIRTINEHILCLFCPINDKDEINRIEAKIIDFYQLCPDGWNRREEGTDTIGSMIVHAHILTQKGWTVEWRQKCEHCGVCNTFPRFIFWPTCCNCNKQFAMYEPTHVKKPPI